MHELDLDQTYLFNNMFDDSLEAIVQSHCMQTPQFSEGICVSYSPMEPVKNSGVVLPVVQGMSTNDINSFNSNLNIPHTLSCPNVVSTQLAQFTTPVMYIQYVYQPGNLVLNAPRVCDSVQTAPELSRTLYNLSSIPSNTLALEPVTVLSVSESLVNPAIHTLSNSPLNSPTKTSVSGSLVTSLLENKENFPPFVSSLLNRDKKCKKIQEFLCPFSGCGLCIKRKDDLARHMRTHSGEKPFICSTCNKRFSRKDHLKSHERTHTKERPYRCPECQRGFARSDERKRHMKTHQKANKKCAPIISPEKPINNSLLGSDTYQQDKNLERT